MNNAINITGRDPLENFSHGDRVVSGGSFGTVVKCGYNWAIHFDCKLYPIPCHWSWKVELVGRAADAVTASERAVARREQDLRELAQDLSHQVEAGELTAEQANEWLAAKQDQWFGGDN